MRGKNTEREKVKDKSVSKIDSSFEKFLRMFVLESFLSTQNISFPREYVFVIFFWTYFYKMETSHKTFYIHRLKKILIFFAQNKNRNTNSFKFSKKCMYWKIELFHFFFFKSWAKLFLWENILTHRNIIPK